MFITSRSRTKNVRIRNVFPLLQTKQALRFLTILTTERCSIVGARRWRKWHVWWQRRGKQKIYSLLQH